MLRLRMGEKPELVYHAGTQSPAPLHLLPQVTQRWLGAGDRSPTRRAATPDSTQDSRWLPEAPCWAILASGRQQCARPPASGVVAEFYVEGRPQSTCIL